MKAKTKILISSIILSITAMVLVFCFLSCQYQTRGIDSAKNSTRTVRPTGTQDKPPIPRLVAPETTSNLSTRQVVLDSEHGYEDMKISESTPAYGPTQPVDPQDV